MPLPDAGVPLSLSQIQTEFGGDNPASLSEYYGVAGGVPASGTLSVSDFYGTSAGAGDPGALRMTIQTVNAAETFELRLIGTGSEGLTVYWGDGTVETGVNTNYPLSYPSHEYAAGGTYNVSVVGNGVTQIFFNTSLSGQKIIQVSNLGALGYTSLQNAFRGCSNMVTFNAGSCDTTQVTTMNSMFDGCSSLESISLTSLDTNLIAGTGFVRMFQGCTSLTAVDIDNFITTGATTLEYMFNNCSSLGNIDLGSLNTPNVTSLVGMFENCQSLGSVSLAGLETANVTNMQNMFQNCSDLQSLGIASLDVSNVTNMSGMLRLCPQLRNLDIDGWDVSSLVNGIAFLEGSDFALTRALYDELLIAWAAQNVQFNVSINFGVEVQYSAGAAQNARAVLTNTYGWNITDGGLFTNDALEFTIQDDVSLNVFSVPITGVTSVDIDWGDGTVDTGVTTDTPSHDYGSATGPFNISVTGTASAIDSTQISVLNAQEITAVTNLGALGYTNLASAFANCSRMTLFACGQTDTASVTSMSDMFINCTALTSIDLTGLSTSSVTNMHSMFENCDSLTSLDLSMFNTSQATDMSRMFNACSAVTTIDVSSFNTSNVTDMRTMFQSCTVLNSLDVSGFNTSNVTNTGGMFDNCFALATIDVSGFNTSNVSLMLNMFDNCTSLENLAIDSWNVTALTNATDFLLNADLALTTAQYDAVLIAWAAQAVQQDVTINFGDVQYTAGGAAETAHNTLISTYGWTITDSGSVVPAQPNDAFELTIETTADGESFLLPITAVTNIDVDWGDGVVDTGITTTRPTHVYATAGVYAISVTGSASDVQFAFSGSESKLRTVTNLGSLGWSGNLFRAFSNCTNMTSFVAGDCDTSGIIDARYMFAGCTSATTIDVSTLDTSSVTDMSYMFLDCSLVTTLDVSNFNTSNTTSILRMFNNCSSLENLDVAGWDVASVTIASNFLLGANNALTTAQYDAVLAAWAAQTVRQNVFISFGDAIPSAAGQADRNILVTTYTWTITDGEGTFT